MTHSLPSYVYAYGGLHQPATFAEALEIAEWFTATDVDHTQVGVIVVSDNAYEMVGFGTDDEGGEFAEDSTYITHEDARRLIAMGVVYDMDPERTALSLEKAKRTSRSMPVYDIATEARKCREGADFARRLH